MTDDISVSFKVGTGFDAPLYNFKGATGMQVKARLMEFFELGSDMAEGSPFEVFLEGQRVAKAVGALQSTFKAEIVPSSKPAKQATLPAVQAEPAKPSAANVEPSSDTADEATQSLIYKIQCADNKADLFDLYGKNKAVWTGAVAKAATAKSAELKL
jgi:hypothetical protein